MGYKIVRMYQEAGKRPRIIRRGLSLEEAQAHCRRPDTKAKGWFDGFTRE
jgi:hypothetical protein